ncbi:hypothetical protein ZWY2020_034017 [Hordeum vulgare]|nr:hypothetical protein ZWY2020_034017 [Hordeum vulgare]
MPATSGHDELLSTLKDELGFSRSQSIGVKDLVQKFADLVEDDDHVMVDLVVNVFFLILYQNLLCPGTAVYLGRVIAMIENMDYAAMAQIYFCRLVVDELQVEDNCWISPASHGPREEDIVLAHNFDSGVVEGLKVAVTNIRSSFTQLNDSHELKCAQYEKDVDHILEEINGEDAGAADDNTGVESAGIDASRDVGLGQLGVATCDMHKDSNNGSEKDEDLVDVSSPLDVVVVKV